LIGCEIGQRGGDLLDITKKHWSTRPEYVFRLNQQNPKAVTIGIIAPYIIDILTKKIVPYKITAQKLKRI
jgi:hypothetical protein